MGRRQRLPGQHHGRQPERFRRPGHEHLPRGDRRGQLRHHHGHAQGDEQQLSHQHGRRLTWRTPPLFLQFEHTPAKSIQFTGVVANFSDTNPAPTLSDFQATIDWGDNTGVSKGNLTPNGVGGFNVIGTHTYAQAGSFTTTTTINDIGGQSTIALGTASVLPNPTPLVPIGQLVVASAGTPIDGTKVVVGSFLDNANPSAAPTDFQVAINWGDGHSSPGTVVKNNATPGLFDIMGTNTYASPQHLLGEHHGSGPERPIDRHQEHGHRGRPGVRASAPRLASRRPAVHDHGRLVPRLEPGRLPARACAGERSPGATVTRPRGRSCRLRSQRIQCARDEHLHGGRPFTIIVVLVNSSGQSATATSTAIVAAPTVTATGTTFLSLPAWR